MSQNDLIYRTITQDDRRTAFADELIKEDGTKVDLTGNTVAFRMTKKADDMVVINDVAATIDSAINGQVSYSWAALDVANTGLFHYWWIVTLTATGTKEHFPGDGKKRLLEIVAKV